MYSPANDNIKSCVLTSFLEAQSLTNDTTIIHLRASVTHLAPQPVDTDHKTTTVGGFPVEQSKVQVSAV